MKILRHRLHHDDGTPYPYQESPNRGGKVDHKFLVIHYTAGSGVDSSIRTLTDSASSASAHLVIGRDGSITQLVPFDRVAWHAGRSKWAGYSGLNQYSIGIELDNAGRLMRSGGKWHAWFGREYDAANVVEATHKNEEAPVGWHAYTSAQIEAAHLVSQLLVRRYKLHDVVGHDDIAPLRKSDPGPAFQIESFRASVLGRQDESPDIFETTDTLNIRSGPGSGFVKLDGSPLPRGTRVEVKGSKGSWRIVDVLDHPQGLMDLEGWVHGGYLRPLA